MDIIKIDAMFVRDLARDKLDLAVVQAVTQVAGALGKATIAGWVESQQVMERLREAGVDFAQGFAVHQPAPLESVVRSLPRSAHAAAAVKSELR